MLARKPKEDQGNFGSPGPGVTAHVLGRQRRGILPKLSKSLLPSTAQSYAKKMLCVGRSDIGRACPYSSKRTDGLKNDWPLFSKSVFPPGARGRSETLVFSYGIFLSTQEVNKW